MVEFVCPGGHSLELASATATFYDNLAVNKRLRRPTTAARHTGAQFIAQVMNIEENALKSCQGYQSCPLTVPRFSVFIYTLFEQ